MSIEQIQPNSAQEPIQVPDNESKTIEGEEANGTDAQQIELLNITFNLPADPHKLSLPAALTETILDLRQSISENPFTYLYSCFYMEHNGVKLSDFQQISSIEGLKEKPEIDLKPDVYSEREARLHIMRLKELMRCYQKSSIGMGYDENLSVFHTVCPNLKKKSKKKSDKVRSPTSLSSHAFEDYNFDNPKISLAHHIPNGFTSSFPKCIRQFTFSGWSPVTPARKLEGDLLYLSIITLEGKTYEITASTTGFFVNNSTPETFDPTHKAPTHMHQAHSLLQLLQKLSPQLRTNFAKIQQSLVASEVLQLFPANHQNVVYPWLTTPKTPAYDVSRATEPYLTKSTEVVEGLREWNEEIQSLVELPRSNLQERLVRDRALNKTFSDFYEAAAQAALMVAEGNLLPLNPSDPPETFMWAHNNLFVTRTYDGVNQFDGYGEEEAAYVASSKDIQGVRVLNSLDLDDLYTFGSTIVDYKGDRFLAQATIPGLFRMHDMIRYGSTGTDKVVVTDEKFHDLTSRIANELHLAPHAVLNQDDEPVMLNLSIDTKGIMGTEGRRYLVDLHRLFPVDINFQETECIAESENAYPHKITLLRQELLDRFWAHKFNQFRDETIKELKAQKEKETEAKEPSDDKETKSDETTDSLGITLEQLKEKFDLRFNTDVFTHLNIAREGEHEAKVKADEKVIREASTFVQEVAIPTFISEVDSNSFLPSGSYTLTKALHSRGINMRYLGKIYNQLGESESPRCQSVKPLFMNEMFSRAIKYSLRKYLREAPLTHVRDCVSHYLNCLFTSNCDELKSIGEFKYCKLTSKSLAEELTRLVMVRFRFPATIKDFEGVSKHYILREVALAVGIQLLARDYHLDTQVESESYINGAAKALFKPSDVLAVVPKIKHALPSPSYPEEIFESGRNAVAQGMRQMGFEHMNESLQFFEQVFGAIHPDTAHAYSNLASIYSLLDELPLAEEYQRKACIIFERSMGIDHSETIQSYIQYGFYLNNLNRPDEGLRFMRFALDRFYTISEVPNVEMAYADLNLGGIFQKFGHEELSLNFFNRALKVFELLNGKDHVSCARCFNAIANIKATQGDFKTAMEIEKQANAIFAKGLGSEHSLTLRSSQALQAYTHNAVQNARVAVFEKSPAFKDYKLKIQQAEKLEKESALKKAESSTSSKGHLPVEDLVDFINGSTTNGARSNLSKNRKKIKKSTKN